MQVLKSDFDLKVGFRLDLLENIGNRKGWIYLKIS